MSCARPSRRREPRGTRRSPSTSRYATRTERAIGSANTSRTRWWCSSTAAIGDTGKRPIPLEELPPYFRGASYAVTALSSRTDNADVRAEALRYRELVTQFLRAATATLEARHRDGAPPAG